MALVYGAARRVGEICEALEAGEGCVHGLNGVVLTGELDGAIGLPVWELAAVVRPREAFAVPLRVDPLVDSVDQILDAAERAAQTLVEIEAWVRARTCCSG